MHRQGSFYAAAYSSNTLRTSSTIPWYNGDSFLMERWEQDMRMQGYGMVLTSTQVDEDARHFYRKFGYKDCGGLTVDVPGYEQPME